MSNIRLFFSNILSANLTDKLDKSQSHYLTKVMRVKKNEVFSLFNKEGEWEAKILEISKSIVEFKTTKAIKTKRKYQRTMVSIFSNQIKLSEFYDTKSNRVGCN